MRKTFVLTIRDGNSIDCRECVAKNNRWVHIVDTKWSIEIDDPRITEIAVYTGPESEAIKTIYLKHVEHV